VLTDDGRRRGRFLTLEGPEGAGKSTQAARLADHLATRGVDVVLTREPGGTPVGEAIREVLLATEPERHPAGPRVDALLFNAARAQLVATVIEPALERGEVVVCDRYADSTLAYQGGGRGLDAALLQSLNRAATGGLTPDLAVFNTPGMDVMVVGPSVAEATLSVRGVRDKGVQFIVEPVREPAGLRRAHERLFAEHGVRYLDCEGGETILRVLHAASLLDEVFVTVTDAVIDESKHEGVLKIFDFEAEGATLIAEGKIGDASGWLFRRWRFNDR